MVVLVLYYSRHKIARIKKKYKRPRKNQKQLYKSGQNNSTTLPEFKTPSPPFSDYLPPLLLPLIHVPLAFLPPIEGRVGPEGPPEGVHVGGVAHGPGPLPLAGSPITILGWVLTTLSPFASLGPAELWWWGL